MIFIVHSPLDLQHSAVREAFRATRLEVSTFLEGLVGAAGVKWVVVVVMVVAGFSSHFRKPTDFS